MRYLNEAYIRGIDTLAFRNREPFPWINPQGFLTESGFQELASHLPDMSLFHPFFGKQRK
jgi:hypothetical protein